LGINNNEDLSLKDDFINIQNYLSEIREKNKENINLNNVSQEYLDSILELESILFDIQQNKENTKSLEGVKDYILSLSNEKIEFLNNFYDNLIKFKNFISNL
jgi:hypothetical protein